nr:rhodanese-like domain-containing protein [Saprospiraceae bacterium]
MLNLFKSTKSFDELSAGDFAEKIRGKESGLIDVRTPAEYKGGHLPGSQNIDLTSAEFLKQMEKLKKSDPVFLYCRSGARSATAANILTKRGFTSVSHLKGGIVSWKGPIIQ